MIRGFVFSTIVHASVLAAAVFSWPNERSECDKLIDEIEREQPGISPIDIAMIYPQCASSMRLPIDIVDVGLVTDIAAVVKPEEPPEEEPEEQQLEENPEETEAPPTIEEEEPEEAPDPKERAAEEEPEEEVVLEDSEPEEAPEEPEEEVEEEAPKEEKLIRKAPPKEATDDLSFLDEFEDTLKDKAKTERRERPKEDRAFQKPVLKDTEVERAGAGKREGNTASLQAAMRRQIGYCWRTVDDLPNPERLVVTIEVKLDIDGNVQGSARVTNPPRRPIGDRYMGTAMDRALLAVRKCAPYKLPADDYDKWKEIEVVIGPES